MKNFFGLAALAFSLAGCLGYSIGPIKPNYMADVHTISVRTFKNETLIPRLEELVTSTVVKQFQQDGTYKVGNDENADAILTAEIANISRSPARSLQGNVLSTTEFNLAMRVKYRLTARDGRVIAPGEVTGTTSYFVDADIVTDERQALPLAIDELAQHLVTQLSEGW
ncbi:MAG TPA: LptE family protein [Chthoniobacterales bacterium]